MDLIAHLRWLAPPPVHPDAEPRTRQAYFVTITVLVVSLVIGIIDLVNGVPTTLLLVGAGVPGLLIALWLISRSHIPAAITLLLLTLLMVLTVVLSQENGIHDIGIILYPVIAMLAGALIGRRALAVFLVLVTLSVGFIVLGEVYHFLPDIHPAGVTHLTDGFTITLIMTIAAVSIRLLMDAPEGALVKVRASEESLTDKVRKLQLLREISLLYSKELDLRTLIERIYEIFPQYFPSTLPNVLIYDPKVGGLISDDQLGVYRDDRPTSDGVTMPGESISGRAFTERRPIIVDDCSASDIIPRAWVERLQLRSCLALPIIAQDQALGVLRLDNVTRTGAFTADHVAFFEMLADQLAIGIQNQRLFEERARTQTALAEGESRFRMLSENVTDVIWASDLRLRFRYVSDSVQKVFGWTPAEWLGLSPEVYLLPESLQIANETIERELQRATDAGPGRDRVVTLELRQYRKDRSTFWTEVVARLLWDGDGLPEGIIGVTRDISDRKYAEEKLKIRVQQLRMLRELSLVYSQVLDLKTFSEKIYEIVPRYRPSLNVTIMFFDEPTNTLVGDGQLGISRSGNVIPPGVQHEGESISGAVLRDRKPVIVEDCSRTDLIPQRWVAMYRMRSTMALPITFKEHFLGVLRVDDVEHVQAFGTDDLEFFGMLADQIAIAIENHRLFEAQRQAEDRLRKSEDSYRSLVENIPNSAIVLFDRDLRFVLVDGPETERTGLTKDRLVGRTLYETFPPEYIAMFEPNMRAVINGVSFDAELPYGDLIFHYTYVPLRDPDGAVEFGMILAQNVTDRRKAEEEVRRLNQELESRVRERTSQLERANQELEAFSYSVSHDLRAPIRHILGYLKLLESDVEGHLGAEGERHLRTVEQSAQRMAQLIDDLLRLSRLSRAEMRKIPTDLTGLVRMLWDRLAAADPSRRISFECGPTSTVGVDPGLMEVALENLLSNARKFTAKTDAPRVEFGQMNGDDGPVFFVRDNGAGFDMAYAKKLFGVFQRLHDSEEFPGTGIGLATVHRILERHHGRIWADGEVDRGATFYFTLPTPP